MPRSSFAIVALLAGCQSALPDAPPPLADMEEPPALFAEPADEDARRNLPLGCYSGVEVADPRTTLEERLAGAPVRGVLVAEVIANSPGDAAGVAPGDLLLSAALLAPGVDPAAEALTAPSQWRRIERDAMPSSVVAVRLDRAGTPWQARITLVPRVRHRERLASMRLREEEKVGVVVRTATEVEAAAAGLGPGGGAVVVGLARGSPWRLVDVRFGDVLTKIGGRAVRHPQDVLELIRNTQAPTLDLEFSRAGVLYVARAALSSRAGEVREVGLPLVFTYTKERGTTTTSCLLGLIHYKSTAAAWRMRLLWFISFGGGDSDRLLEVSQ